MTESPLAAYWRFFELFNTRDAYSFASAMSYPHIRVSWARPPTLLADLEAHALTLSWDAFIQSGWNHTKGSEPELIATTTDKAHIKGGWTRYTEANEPLLSNEVCYIATNIDGHWGIQSRFGTDPGKRTNSNQDVQENDALNQVETFLLGAVNENQSVVSTAMGDECFVIGVGSVERIKRDSVSASFGMATPQLNVIHRGPHSITVLAQDGEREALIYAVLIDGCWLVKAGSWL